MAVASGLQLPCFCEVLPEIPRTAVTPRVDGVAEIQAEREVSGGWLGRRPFKYLLRGTVFLGPVFCIQLVFLR